MKFSDKQIAHYTCLESWISTWSMSLRIHKSYSHPGKVFLFLWPLPIAEDSLEIALKSKEDSASSLIYSDNSHTTKSPRNIPGCTTLICRLESWTTLMLMFFITLQPLWFVKWLHGQEKAVHFTLTNAYNNSHFSDFFLFMLQHFNLAEAPHSNNQKNGCVSAKALRDKAFPEIFIYPYENLP